MRWLTACLVLLAAGCRQEPPPVAGDGAMASVMADSALVARARDASAALGGHLLTLLTGAMERGGPTEAIGYCADSAQAVTARYSAEGIAVRRTSLRVRNPANRPDADERRILEHLQARQAAGGLPAEYTEVLVKEEGSPMLQFSRPIVVQPQCLGCHGDRESLDPAVREMLAERYPADSATGYRAGDFRGMVSVRVPVPGR